MFGRAEGRGRGGGACVGEKAKGESQVQVSPWPQADTEEPALPAGLGSAASTVWGSAGSDFHRPVGSCS